MEKTVKNNIELIINSKNCVDYKNIENNIENIFLPKLQKYYLENNIYHNNRFKRQLPKWYIDKFLKIEKNIIMKKYLFTSNYKIN